METLINALLKMGASRSRLEVKLFGGGHVLNAGINVGDRNIEFARHWLKTEELPIVAEDVGGTSPRRVIYFPSDGKVRVKHLRPTRSRKSRHASSATWARWAMQAEATGDDIELFEE